MSTEVRVGPVHVGGGPLALIAGPCVIEDEFHLLGRVTAIAPALARPS